MSTRLIYSFLPLKGLWDWALVRLPTTPSGVGGGTVSAGVLTLPTGTTFEINVGINLTGTGALLVEPGATLVVI